MSLLQEFKTFAMRGNVFDMAVGIVIGSAFGKITASLVSDVLMPPIGMLIAGVPFKTLSFTLKEATAETPAVVINYGQFILTVVDFIIIAFVVFLLVKSVNRMRHKEEAKPAPPPPPPTPSKEEILLAEIRDLLRKS